MPENRTNRANQVLRHSKIASTGTVHVNLTATIVAFALARGMTQDEIERVAEFNLSSLGAPDARIKDDVIQRLWSELSRREPDRAVPLEAARAAPFTTMGGLAHGIQFAGTLREGIAFSRRNSSVLADRLHIQLVEVDDEVRVVSTHPLDALDGGCMAEMGMGIVSRLFREIMGLVRPIIRVDLAHQPRGPVAAYETFFDCPVSFETPHNALVIHPDTIDRPIRMAEPTLFAFIENHFEITRRQIEAEAGAEPLSILKRAIAAGSAAGDYRTEAILDRAGMARRTAQRLASAHGTTLKHLIEDARRANAEAFLADPTISVDMVASLLGYSDDRAFRRAFKRWTNKSPAEFRKTRRSLPT
ncbi:MAG: AraC family transcriptional regulator ligand-binding domain-containing protein [Pseudomonadota bacterium]